jgi:hypothetical protein
VRSVETKHLGVTLMPSRANHARLSSDGMHSKKQLVVYIYYNSLVCWIVVIVIMFYCCSIA